MPLCTATDGQATGWSFASDGGNSSGRGRRADLTIRTRLKIARCGDFGKLRPNRTGEHDMTPAPSGPGPSLAVLRPFLRSVWRGEPPSWTRTSRPAEVKYSGAPPSAIARGRLIALFAQMSRGIILRRRAGFDGGQTFAGRDGRAWLRGRTRMRATEPAGSCLPCRSWLGTRPTIIVR